MTKQRQYEVLTNARGHLAAGWVANQTWLADDTRYGAGPVCASGAVLRSTTELEVGIWNSVYWASVNIEEIVKLLHTNAVALFGPAVDSMYAEDRHVEVNNKLGQQAILSVFDRALATLETELIDETARPLIESATAPAPVRLGHEDWTYE